MSDHTIKAVFFDFMGTCLDWHQSLIKALPDSIPEQERSKLVLEWRQDFFNAIAERHANGMPPEDIDMTHKRTLNSLLQRHDQYMSLFSEDVQVTCVAAWHSMQAWPEVAQALQRLKDAGYEIFVLANGTTRLQLDLCKTSTLKFDMLFSSELLGSYKPAPESYRRCLELVNVKTEAAVMVAAHAYDLRAAKQIGMKTVYIHRWTDDTHEDMGVVRLENNVFLQDMTTLAETISQL